MRSSIVGLVLIGLSLPAEAQQTLAPVTYGDVWIRYGGEDKDIRMRSDDAIVVLDQAQGRLFVRHKKRPLDIAFDKIKTITFEKSTHIRGGRGGGLGGLGLVGAIAAAAIQSGTVSDNWCLLEFEGADGMRRSYLLEFDKKIAPDALSQMQTLFSDRVIVPKFESEEREVLKRDIPKLPKTVVTVRKEQRPAFPEPRTDKALVVVVCPAVDAKSAGKGNTHVLMANGTIVTANRMGTFNYIFLEPGAYTLLSIAGKGSELKTTLDAGKEYFFFQDTLSGRSALTQHTKALVMNELAGSYFAEWAIKR